VLDGELSNGPVILCSSCHVSVFQILTLLSSDWN